MKPTLSFIRRSLDRVHRRFRAARPGSVLIFVVALLVLIALIATAFVSTARTDRYSAAQNSANTEIDLLVEGVVNITVAELVKDLFGPEAIGAYGDLPYRPSSDIPVTAGLEKYEHNDNPLIDKYLADRLPTLPNEAVAATAPPFGGNNPPLWRSVSWPLIANGPTAAPYQFDSPNNVASVSVSAAGATKSQFTFFPVFLVNFGGQPIWPGMQIVNTTAAINTVLPAADADGDGIADAGLWKLPVGTLNGVTYYAAVRIIDNAAAINANTAFARDVDFTGAGATAAASAETYFLGRVGLAEILRTYAGPGYTTWSGGTGPGTEMDRLNEYRFTGIAATPAGVGSAPLDDTGAARGDFQFLSVMDALDLQLGRRIDNPSFNTAGKYKAFTIADSMALAYRFCLVNPYASRSLLETALGESLYGSAAPGLPGATYPVPTSPYQIPANGQNNILNWYNQNFNFGTGETGGPTTWLPRRALIVARNPVSNQAPARFAAGDTTLADGFRNDLPIAAVAPGAIPNYIPTQLTVPPPTRQFAMEPYSTGGRANPPKTSLNTATFPELWRSYWNVMVSEDNPAGGYDGPLHTPVDRAILTFEASPANAANPKIHEDPYYGTGFSAPTDLEEQNPARQFRSSIRNTLNPNPVPNPIANNVRLHPYQQMLLRSAIAAVNTEDLRDPDDNVSARRITLAVDVTTGGTTVREATEATVYGNERQPFITEVYYNSDTTTGNPRGYVAIELYNPDPVNDILLAPSTVHATGTWGWSVGVIDRRSGARGTMVPVHAVGGTAGTDQWAGAFQIRNLSDDVATLNTWVYAADNLVPNAFVPWRFPVGTVVPAGGYLILENYNDDVLNPGVIDPNKAALRPAQVTAGNPRLLASGTPAYPPAPGDAPLKVVFVPGLDRVINDLIAAPLGTAGGEFVLLRPRLATTEAVNNTANPADPYNEIDNLQDMIPVDSFDFSNVTLPPVTAPETVREVRYTRRTDGWNFVYPGRYDASLASGIIRHDGSTSFDYPAGTTPAPAPAPTLGVNKVVNGYPTRTFPIQLANTDFAGPRNITTATPDAYPFGGFARDGDIFKVPFIGGYIIDYPEVAGREPDALAAARWFYEMNSVTMDSVFAEDSDTADDPYFSGAYDGVEDKEQIGRFYPIARDSAVGPAAYVFDDFSTNVPAAGSGEDAYWSAPLAPGPGLVRPAMWRYHWAMDVLDYFTVNAPHDDYFPNVSPLTAMATATPVGNTIGTAATPGNRTNGATTDDHNEDTVPVDGLINVNTASWKVLSTLPWALDPATGAVDAVESLEMANMIVYWRDQDSDPVTPGPQPHGPFNSLIELNEVYDLRTGGDPNRSVRAGGLPGGSKGVSFDVLPANDPGDPSGDLSPFGAGTDAVRSDFEERTLVLNRISNLITTRSDSYTCYITVQGWRDAGTNRPTLVVQRRVAFIVDRSNVTPANHIPSVTYVPNN